MTDYKDTLNLPKTDFSMKANLAQREPDMLKHWQELDIYNKLREQRAGAEQYIFHDGPPYANGKIHLGHAVNKTLKDIVVKSQTLNGLDAPYVPGWDCHGLPIEINVEKKVGKPGQKISAQEFRQHCREYAETQVAQQSQDFQRLGVFGDWKNPYLTMDFKYEANIIRSLKTIIERGHLQQGFKPVYWCFDCQSSLAEAEVEYQDKQSFSIDVKFCFVNQASVLKCFHAENLGHGDVSIIIWTTTPWTLPANQAVAVNPDLEYALVQVGEQRFVVAHDLVNQAMQRYAIKQFEILARCMGRELQQLTLHHPFYEKQVPIVLGAHVTLDAGTGAVHTAPAHGEDDYRIGLANNLLVDSYVQANGVYRDDTPLFAGLHVYKANQQIVDLLQAQKQLIYQDKLQHSYPHCWRHKTPVIYRATPQWFISMTKQNLSADALAETENVTWLPEWGKQRMQNMLGGRPDWCISRQRTWGVPIPLFVENNTQALHPNTLAIMDKVALLVEQQGIDAWYQVDPAELIGDDAQQYSKISDVLDVWYDSGVSHYCVLQARDNLHTPADLYLEGSDQYRGWFQSSLLTSVAMHSAAPYKTNITHGFTVDESGRKMSKSIGNTIEPEKVWKTLGADIIRLWVANTDYTAEMAVSDQILKRTSDLYRRIRNTARFLLSNLDGFVPEQHSLPADTMLKLDCWVVSYATQLQAEIINAYNHYQFQKAVQKIHHFCAVELGGFYLDIIKDRQYTCKESSVARRSAQTAMFLVLEALVRWIAPVLVFTADEIWHYMPGEREQSVHLTTWFNGLFQIAVDDAFNHDYWQQLMQVREVVNKEIEQQRANGQIGSALEAEVYLYADKTLLPVLEQLKDELRFLLITSNAMVLPLKKAVVDAADTEIPGLQVLVKKSEHQKCQRCWHRQADIGESVQYSDICQRCVDNISGDGELRNYV
jgi:isoleucyl-tRNA synthetase